MVQAKVLSIILIVIVGCYGIVESPSGTPTTYYFPLKVGNSWTYHFSGMNGPLRSEEDRTMSVIGAVLHGGKTYFKLDTPLPPVFRDTLLVRLDERGDMFVLQGDSESVRLKFSAPVGSSWGGLEVSSKGDSFKTSVGTFTNCVTIETLPPNFEPSTGYRMGFSPGVGLVWYSYGHEVFGGYGSLISYNLK